MFYKMDVKTEYQKTLVSANYKDNLNYDNTILSKRNKRKRTRVFFNPPFSLTVSSEIGKQFLNSISTFFD